MYASPGTTPHVANMKKLLLPALALLLVPPLSAAPGDLDQTFLNNLGAGITGSGYPDRFPNGAVQALGIQPDGKILLGSGGGMSRFNNTGELTALKRLNADGTLDGSFAPNSDFENGPHTLVPGEGAEVNVILVNPDGSFYIGGVFANYGPGSAVRSCLAKINADGTLDEDFVPPALSGGQRYVQSLALDGKGGLLVGGTFFTSGRNNLIRLNAETGAVDPGFTLFSPSNYPATVDSIALAADGRVYISGITSNSRPCACRLLEDGTVDNSFAVPFTTDFGRVNKILPLPDGRVLLGGTYSLLGRQDTEFLAATDVNGALDAAFMTNLGTGPNGWVGGVLQLLPDGRVLAGGIFNEHNGTPIASLMILGTDGVREAAFTPAPYSDDRDDYLTHFYAAGVQPDGKLVAGGWFERVTDPDLDIRNLVRFEGETAAGAGTLRFVSAAYSALENAGAVTVQVARLPGVSGAVSVNFATGGGAGTAVPGTDYTATSGTLNWADGEGGVKSITIPLINNSVAAAAKTFRVALSAAAGGAVIGSVGETLVTILDDDALPVIVTPPANVTLNQGGLLSLRVTAASPLPLTYQWQFDNGGGFQNLAGQTLPSLLIGQVTPAAHAGQYRVIVSNDNGPVESAAATVIVNVPAGSVIPEFNASVPNPVVKAVQDAQGRYLLATNTRIVVRRNADGSTDSGFTSPVFDNNLTNLLPLPDGKVLVSGFFQNVGGVPRRGVARLNADGTLDESLNLGLTLSVQSLAPGAGGKFYVGFTNGSGNGLRRYNNDGTLDSGFTATGIGLGVTNGYVWAVKERGDGTLFVAHTTTPGATYSFSRLNVSDGSAVAGFTVGTMNWNIYDWDFLPDGRIVIGGRFTTLGGVTRNRIAILNADGTLDTQFDAGTGPGGPVLGVKYFQGRIFAWGEFTLVNGVAQRGIARFNLDGSSDASFIVGTGANGNVVSAFFPPGGPIHIFGAFTMFNGVTKNYAAALVLGPGSAGFEPARITAIEGAVTLPLTLRRYGSASGEASIAYATADGTAVADTDYLSASGTVTWADGDAEDKTVNITLVDNALVQSTRTFTVQLSDATGDIMPAANATITVLDNDTPVTFTTQPSGASIFEGGSFTLTAATTSPTPTTYQWFLNGSPVAGANAVSYARTGAAQTEGGLYTLVATNAAGSFVSGPALVVIAPTPGSVSSSLAPAGVRLSLANVRAIAPTPDGGAWLGGTFSFTQNSVTYTNLVRVHADGTLNTAFNPVPNNTVEALLLVEDDKLLVGGSFTTLAGSTARRFARLNADGTLDTAFTTNLDVGGTFLNNTSVPTSNTITRIARLSDGRIVITGGSNGSFGQFHLIAADGLRDLTFQGVNKANNNITSLAIFPDDKILIGGVFNQYNGVSVNRPVRVNTDGTRDTSFSASGAVGGTLADVLVDRLGRVFIGGSSLTSSVGFAFLNESGAYTTSMGVNNVLRLHEEASGKVLVMTAGSLVRYKGSDPVPTPGSGDSDSTFPAFLPGGNMQVVTTGPDRSIWVGGVFTGGFTKLNSDPADPDIVNPPAAQAVNPGATAFLSVGAAGTGLSYKWFKNGIELEDGGRISGATTAILTLSDVVPADDDLYHVEVTGGTPENTVTSTPVRLRVLGAPEIATQLADQTPTLGSTLTLAPEVYAADPATYVWKRDGVTLINGGRYSGANTAALTIAGVNATDNGVYTLTITNSQGSITTAPATVTADAYVAAARDPATAWVRAQNTSTQINAILHLPDGRTLIGSTASSAGGGVLDSNGTLQSSGLVLVSPNGQISSTAAGGFARQVNVVLPMPGGKYLVAGNFSTINGGNARNAVRLNADFSRDNTFTVPETNAIFDAAHIDAQGRVYVGGFFNNYSGQSGYNHLIRFNTDGTLDTSFNAVINGAVQSIVTLPDGRFYVGGNFTNHSSIPLSVPGLLRFLPDGRVDASFNAVSLPIGTPNALAVDSLGRVIVGGAIGVRRLLPDGSIDPSFTGTVSLNNGVRSLVALPDGKILVGGFFTSPANRFLRLNADGTHDTGFDVGTGFGTSGTVNAIAPDAIGRIWLSGTGFTTYKSVASSALGFAILQDEAPTLAFTRLPTAARADFGGTVTFTAAGTGNNGFTYRWLKNGVPLSDGPGVSGAHTATLTLTGVTAATAGNYSVRITGPGGTVTSPATPLDVGPVIVPPSLTSSPGDATRDLGGNVTFTVGAKGALPLTFEWFHFDTPLANGVSAGATITGATTPNLTITGLTFAQAGEYRVRVTNPDGTITTQTALLTVERRPGGLAPGLPGATTANGNVLAILRLADGSMLVGGQFGTITVNGVSNNRSRLARFLADGTLDPDFNPAIPNTVRAIAQDAAGRVFIAGDFNGSLTVGGVTANRNRVARLTSALVLDTAFDTSTNGPNANINALAPTENGGVYIGGVFGFNQFGTTTVNRIARLDAAGANDGTFTAATSVNNEVRALLRRADGKLYAGGTFGTQLLNANGTRDNSFAPEGFFVLGQALLLLPDGSLVVAANGASPQNYLRRLNANTGATLADYSTGHSSQVNALARQSNDGKLLSGSLGVIKRTDPETGTDDTGFSTFNSTISALAVDGSGRIWVGGSFNQYGGVAQSSLAILNGGEFESRNGAMASQTITFTSIPDRVFNPSANSFAIAPTSSSGLPVSVAVTSGPATVNGGTVTITGAGEVTLTATQAGDDTYGAAAPVVRTFTVAKADQTISFPALADRSAASAPFHLSASATSGLPVTFSLISGPASVDGSTVTLTGAPGTVVIEATQAGDANWNPAAPVQRSFEATDTPPVTLPQIITFPKPPAKRFLSESPVTLFASASSGLDVVFQVVAGPATVNGSQFTFTGTGKVTVRATQPGGPGFHPAAPVTQSFSIAADPARLTLTDLVQVYDGTPRAVNVIGNTEAPVITYIINKAESDIPPVNAGSYAVAATADGRTVKGKLVILKAPLTATPDSHRRFIGQDNPPLTLAYSGFLAGDDESVLDAPGARRPVVSTTAKANSPGGVYPVRAAGGLLANYNFVYVNGSLTVESFAGRYEALLVDGADQPAAKVELTVAASSAVLSGRLTVPGETTALPFKGTLSVDPDTETATGATAEFKKGANTYLIEFTLPLGGDFSADLSLNGAPLAATDEGKKIYLPVKGDVIPAGAHTLSLAPAQPAGADTPAGSGYALAALDAKGVLKLAGRLADGTALTGALMPDAAFGYRLLALPYKRLDSHVTGWLDLEDHPVLANRKWIPAASAVDLLWEKAEGTKDKSYRAGIGPVTTRVTLDPWLRPDRNTSLATLLALPAGEEFFVEHDGFTSDAAGNLPTDLQLNAKNQILILAPVTTPVNATKWTAKFNTANGLVTGSLTLSDTLPGATRPTARKVPFTGVLRQPHGTGAGGPIGAGYLLVPALPGAPTNELTSGSILFEP